MGREEREANPTIVGLKLITWLKAVAMIHICYHMLLPMVVTGSPLGITYDSSNTEEFGSTYVHSQRKRNGRIMFFLYQCIVLCLKFSVFKDPQGLM